jgi:signal transduction histidine kinase
MTWFFIGVGLGVLLTIPIAVFFSKRLIARVRLLERKSLANERLAELGTMTGGLAHEIKNPLSTVNLNLQLLREDIEEVISMLPADTVPLEKFNRIERRGDSLLREIKRLKEILDDFLRFAGRVKLDLAPVDINSLVDELVDFYQPQAQGASIRIRTQLDANPSTLTADVALLKQAILNLLINATQAMIDARAAGEAHGGCDELIIRTNRGRSLGQDELQIHIIDTGPGIPADRVDKIFQPYFTTKKGGTGLGLPTARRIVQEHGGSLVVHSDPGRGTDFTITLPEKR